VAYIARGIEELSDVQLAGEVVAVKRFAGREHVINAEQQHEGNLQDIASSYYLPHTGKVSASGEPYLD
jgi:hypothetical protein